MRYEVFRDRVEHALRDAGVSFLDLSRKETLELPALARTYEIAIELDERQQARPFHVAGSIEFRWDPFQIARSYTTEEDLLTELLGRKMSEHETKPRWQRVEMRLQANLPDGSTVSMPDSRVWTSWTTRVARLRARLVPVEAAEDEDGQSTVAGWRGDVAVRATCSDDGVLLLHGLEIATFQVVSPSRARDDTAKRGDDISGQLDQLARRFRIAFDEWMDRVAELARRLGLAEDEGA